MGVPNGPADIATFGLGLSDPEKYNLYSGLYEMADKLSAPA
jgi:hypothetical protein